MKAYELNELLDKNAKELQLLRVEAFKYYSMLVKLQEYKELREELL